MASRAEEGRRVGSPAGSLLILCVVSFLAGALCTLAFVCMYGKQLEHRNIPMHDCLAGYDSPARAEQKGCSGETSIPKVRQIASLYQSNYGREGLSHITIVGSLYHGANKLEFWLQWFEPGLATPIHSHSNEESFVILRGRGTLTTRSSAHNGSAYRWEHHEFTANDTLWVPPNVVHELRNTGDGPMQALVLIAPAPIDVRVYPSWDADLTGSLRVQPYTFDRECPTSLFATHSEL
mmetsp:Transcript_3781/g.13507  ORF Transcript_3781/g.13507 Transcript_3781/m.13507 type:complete len:236 (+) Transcript_3781:311-1018(+)|eukprot:scaffold744_cov370-Prasinococcus_capsulatus_cf.AAC.6